MRHTTDVSDYYDINTRRFLALGQGGSELAIHRAVWKPGVATRPQAMNYVNDRILALLKQINPGLVVDLGCGVGGTMLHLSGSLATNYRGVTISEVQGQIASDLLVQWSDRSTTSFGGAVTVDVGDFGDPAYWKSYAEPADAMYAVESFIHVPDLLRKIPLITSHLRPGGLLVVCDDMLSADDPGSTDRAGTRWTREFREGWHTHGLSPVGTLLEACEQSGLRLMEFDDLTPYLELDRPRDLAARALVGLTRWTGLRAGWYENLLGGNALQLLLRNRIVRYVFAAFQRVNSE